MATGSELFLTAWAAAAVLMLAMWIWQYRSCNAGIVDIAWAFFTPLVATWLILADDIDNAARQFLLILMALGWGWRLAYYLFGRVMNEEEDGRYRYMREHSGRYAQPVMFVFFQVQATWTLLFALPFWAASRNTSPGINWLDIAGFSIWLTAILGEWLSDRQLSQFKKEVQDRSRICDRGLWRYSCHPNYFFEWLQWFAFVLIGFGSDKWWLTILGVVIMYIFITRVTGIPWTEQQSLRSKGDAYQAYLNTTSRFFPLPPGLTGKHTALDGRK